MGKKKPLSSEKGVADETLPHLLGDDEYRRRLPDHIALAEKLLSFGIELPKAKDLHSTSFPRDAVVTVIGLFTKANVTFRSIIVLCNHSLDRPATALSRSLFETLLNLTFLTRRRVSLYCFNNSKPKPKTPVPLHGKKLTPEFRVALFNAWCMLRSNKAIEGWELTPGLKRDGQRTRKKLDRFDKSYIDVIGPEWAKVIKRANTCAGIGILDFAASLGSLYHQWYRTVYAGDSSFVHQSDIPSYLNITEDGSVVPRIYTSPREISGMLHRAAMVYLWCLAELNRRFRFGEDIESTTDRFSELLMSFQ